MSYLKLDKDLLKATQNLTATAVVALITEVAEQHHTATPIIQQTYIARTLGISTSTAQRAVKTLTAGGYITHKPTYFHGGKEKHSATLFQLTDKTRTIMAGKQPDSNTTPATTKEQGESHARNAHGVQQPPHGEGKPTITIAAIYDELTRIQDPKQVAKRGCELAKEYNVTEGEMATLLEAEHAKRVAENKESNANAE